MIKNIKMMKEKKRKISHQISLASIFFLFVVGSSKNSFSNLILNVSLFGSRQFFFLLYIMRKRVNYERERKDNHIEYQSIYRTFLP